MDNLYLIGFAQALFFVVLILTKKNKLASDYLLSFFILLLGGQLFFVYSYSSGWYQDNSWIAIVDIYYWTFLGPTLLLYIQFMMRGQAHFNWKYLLYLAPTVIVTAGFYEYIFVDSATFFANTAKKSWFYNLTIYVWFYNSLLFYVLAIIQLRKHSKQIKDFFSYSKNIDLKWLYFLSNGFAAFLLFSITKPYIMKILNLEIPSSYNYTWLVMVFYVLGIGFYGYKQRGIFSNIENNENPTFSDNKNILKLEISDKSKVEIDKSSYQKSGLNDEEAEKLSRELLNLMENEKLYLDYELNLISLTKKLKTTTHKLSQIINEKFGKNFFEFVNDYRIEEVKNQLILPEKNKYNIIALAYECGFNSKSTFYTIFKKSTSLTPSEFRRKFQKKVG